METRFLNIGIKWAIYPVFSVIKFYNLLKLFGSTYSST